MILSKIILAATMSATVLWLTPIHSNGQHPVHEQCAYGHDLCDADCGVDCDHEHCGSDCDHEDADYAMPTTASPDAHTGHSHSAVHAGEKCTWCKGKGWVSKASDDTCSKCGGEGKYTYIETTTCPRCKGKGSNSGGLFKCIKCKGEGNIYKTKKAKCLTCNGKGHYCFLCKGTGQLK